MRDGICFAGLDVHARKTVGAAVWLGSGEVFRAQIAGSPTEAIGWLQTLPGPVRAVYEAGPTGFGLARAARAAGIEMMVCSPGAIPRQPGDRVKTDKRDALKLARLHAAGQLRAVLVPDLPLEGLRDLVRAREDLRGDLMACRHRISKLLLRRGLVWAGPGSTWSQRHLSWLSRVRFDDPLVELVFSEHLACHEVLLARRDRLERAIDERAEAGPWSGLVGRLRCLRGVDTLTAVGLVAESVTSRRSIIRAAWPATSAWSRQRARPAPGAGRARSPRPDRGTPAGSSLKRPGITGDRRACRLLFAAASTTSHRP